MARKPVEWITQAEYARRIGVTSRHAYRLVQEPGFPMDRKRKGREVVEWPTANVWYIDYRVRSELAKVGGPEAGRLQETKLSKADAEARIAQIELAQLEETLIFLEDHEAVIDELLDLLTKRLNAAPGRLGPLMVGCRTIPEAVKRLRPYFAELVDALRAQLEEQYEDADDVAAAS